METPTAHLTTHQVKRALFAREPLLLSYFKTPVVVELSPDHMDILLHHFNDFRDAGGNTLLMHAYKKRDFYLCNALLQKCPDYSYLNSSDREGFSLFLLSCRDLDYDFMQHLSLLSIDWLTKTKCGNNALMLACKNPDLEEKHLDFFLGCKDFLDLMNDQNLKSMSPLHYLIHQKKPALIKYLLKKSLKIRPWVLNEALCFACSKSDISLDIIGYLLQGGACIHHISDFHNGDIPLSLAIETGNLDLVKMLCDHGANIYHVHPFTDETMMEIAHRCGFSNIVDYLFSRLGPK